MGGHTGGNERDWSCHQQRGWHWWRQAKQIKHLRRCCYTPPPPLPPPLTAGMSLVKECDTHTHTHTQSSSPFLSPTLIYELNLGDCFPQEREKHIPACLLKDTHTHTHAHTRTQCHKPMPAIHVKVKWSRKTNRCARGKPLVWWAPVLE